MADKEGARKSGVFLVISKSPDVCKTPMGSALVPVPYMIVADLSQSTGVSADVRFAGAPVFLLDKSSIPKVKGDEAGTGGGVRSGTFVNVCEPKQASQTGRTNRAFVVRDGDAFWMNNRNTDGILVFLSASAPACKVGADGSCSKDTSPPVEPTQKEKDWLDKLGDWWERSKKEMREAVPSPGQGTLGAGKDLANTVPELGEMIGRGEMLNSASEMEQAAAWNALFGNEKAANDLLRAAQDVRGASSSFELPKFDLSNAAQRGGAKISQGIQLATGLAALLKRGVLSMGKLGTAASAASEGALVTDVAQAEKVVANAARTEEAMATAAEGEEAAGTASKSAKGEAGRFYGAQADEVKRPEMPQDLDVPLRDELDALFREARKKLDAGNKDEAVAQAKQAWSKLPEPRFDWDVSNSYTLALAGILRDAGLFPEALELMDAQFASGTVLPYEDQPRIMLGSIYAEMGDREKAKKWIGEANRISKGRCFFGRWVKYRPYLD